MEKGLLDEAEAVLNEFQKHHAMGHSLLLNYGILLAIQNKHDSAISKLQAALSEH